MAKLYLSDSLFTSWSSCLLMQNQPVHKLTQLIKLSSQPALLVEITSDKLIASNDHCVDLLGLKSDAIITSELYIRLMKKAHQLSNAGLHFFNYEIYIDDKIFLVIAEIQEAYLVIYLQEKFNYNMPSSNLISILDSLGAYVYCKDTNYRYTYANKMVTDLFGKDFKSLAGTTDDNYFGPKNIKENIDRLVIDNNKSIEKEENLFVKKLNEVRTFLSVKKPLHGKNNKVVGLFGISTDISEYKATEQKLNTILDNVAAYIYIRDINHCFNYANKMTQSLFQLSMEEIEGKTPTDILDKINGEEFQRLDLDLLRTKKTVEGVETFIDGDDTYYFWTVKAPLYDEEGNINGIIGMSTDITEKIKLEKSLEKTNKELKNKINEITKLQESLWEQATQDPLTQIFNRRYFNEISKKEIQKSKRSNKPLALLLLDADYFKKINDNFGHDIGDQVLIKLAKIMIGECRRTDVICRFGGEEFVILMPEANAEIALERAEEIRLRYQKEITEFLKTKTTLSIGVAMWNKDFKNIEGFTKAADQAMYQAKENGRNQVIIYK